MAYDTYRFDDPIRLRLPELAQPRSVECPQRKARQHNGIMAARTQSATHRNIAFSTSSWTVVRLLMALMFIPAALVRRAVFASHTSSGISTGFFCLMGELPGDGRGP